MAKYCISSLSLYFCNELLDGLALYLSLVMYSVTIQFKLIEEYFSTVDFSPFSSPQIIFRYNVFCLDNDIKFFAAVFTLNHVHEVRAICTTVEGRDSDTAPWYFPINNDIVYITDYIGGVL